MTRHSSHAARLARIGMGSMLLIAAATAGIKIPKFKAPEDPFPQIWSYPNQGTGHSSASPGSIYFDGGRLADGVRDLRASQLHDLLTITVNDVASAVSSGVTTTARKSSASASISSLVGPLKATGALANLAKLSGNQQLAGQGTTSRQSTLTATVTAEVIAVLPNGNLIIEGKKEVLVNSERQVTVIRGIIRPEDVSSTNSITSDRIASLAIRVNGKGVVADSVKRPFILYRILMGLLPF